jgi:hypothetical protein
MQNMHSQVSPLALCSDSDDFTTSVVGENPDRNGPCSGRPERGDSRTAGDLVIEEWRQQVCPSVPCRPGPTRRSIRRCGTRRRLPLELSEYKDAAGRPNHRQVRLYESVEQFVRNRCCGPTPNSK